MSSFASFYLMNHVKFDEYCKLAGLYPVDELPQAKDQPSHTVIQYVGSFSTAELHKMPGYKRYQKLYKFLRANSQEPFEYEWSGYVLFDLLNMLKEDKHIDLMSKSFQDSSGNIEMFMLDLDSKSKYFDQLDPSRFSDIELSADYHHYREREKEQTLKDMAANLTKEEMQEWLNIPQLPEEPFPGQGKAMIDGIKIIHDYLKLVTDTTIVMYQIG